MRVDLKKARVYVHACASSGIRQTFRVNRKNGPKKAFFFYFGIFSVGEAVSNAWVLFFPFLSRLYSGGRTQCSVSETCGIVGIVSDS